MQWLYGNIDLLGSEYGWEYKTLMNDIGLVDLIFLADNIKRRRAGAYLIETHIISYPNMKEEDQKEFIRTLQRESEIEAYEEDIDVAANINRLKMMMSQGSGFQVK